MEEYPRGVIADFPEEITETAETPAASNLFDVRDNNKLEILNKTRAQAFHPVVAQLLFTRIQCRKDAQTAYRFPNDESEEAGRGQLAETEETARVPKTKN